MNWMHLLTIIFVIAKLLEKIDWSWWIVFIPSIASAGLTLFFLLVAVVIQEVWIGSKK